MRRLAAKGGTNVPDASGTGPLQCILPDPTNILTEKSRRKIHTGVETGKKCKGTVYADGRQPGLASRRFKDVCPGFCRTNAPALPSLDSVRGDVARRDPWGCEVLRDVVGLFAAGGEHKRKCSPRPQWERGCSVGTISGESHAAAGSDE